MFKNSSKILSILSKIDTILRFVSCLFAEDKMRERN